MNYYYDNYTPRPTSQVYSLRKEGKIDQAYQCASKLYENNPGDEDIKKAYAWTLIDLCKREHANGNLSMAQEWMSKLSSLDFKEPYDDFTNTILKVIKSLKVKLNPFSDRINLASDLSKNGQTTQAYEIMSGLAREGHITSDSHENYGWIIYRYLKDNIQTLTSVQARSILRDYIQLTNSRPSNLHSQILNFALNYSKRDPAFKLIPFLKLWGPQYITNGDFRDSLAQDGKTIPSLMKRISREVVKYSQEEVKEFIELLPVGQAEFVEMLREGCFWNLYNLMNENKYNELWRQFEAYLSSYAQYEASASHSKILSLAERSMKDANQYRFYEFFRKWNPEKLRDEDWKEERNENGDTYKSLALKALKRAADALSGFNTDTDGDFSWLIDAYSTAVSKNPDDDWTIRTKAMLLHRAGRVSEASEIYKDLTLRLGDKYYVWSEFADCVSEPDVKIGMLCKAILMERNEDFLGQIRLNLAEQLINQGKKEAAAYEIKLHKDLYTSKGWSIKQRVYSLENTCGQVDTLPENNRDLYYEFISHAEEYAYSEIPYTDLVFVDEWTNQEGKKFQKYVDGRYKEVVINIRKFPKLKWAKLGQVWSFKLYTSGADKDIPLIVKRSQVADWSILPLQYGYVQYVNEDNKVYHVYSQNSSLIYERYDRKKFAKGDYVSFRKYGRWLNSKYLTNIYCLKKCDESEAVGNFQTAIIAVDGVNDKKQLFHYVLGYNRPSGVIHYDKTDIRPCVGDLLRIYYYERERKDIKSVGPESKIVEVLKVEATTEENPHLVCNFSGYLKINYRDSFKDGYIDADDLDDDGHIINRPKFAFVNDFYVPSALLGKHGIEETCWVHGKAVYTGNGKWKAFWLEVR